MVLAEGHRDARGPGRHVHAGGLHVNRNARAAQRVLTPGSAVVAVPFSERVYWEAGPIF